ncbi:MAG: hypothetical protein AAF687_06150 [Pseudomonadota bacterium]
MEVLGGIIASLVAMALLAGVGLMTVVALAMMLILGLLTEWSFKRLFFVSFGIGLLAPVFLAVGLGNALADGSFQNDLREELSDVVQLPDDLGESWGEALPQLREISRQVDAGELTEEEAEARVKEVLGQFEGLNLSIDMDGNQLVIGDESAEGGDTGVPLDIPETVEADGAQDSGSN